MELQLPLSLLFSFLACSFFFFFFFFFKWSKSSSTNQNLPPQPWKLPFIGHLHHLSGASPHRVLGGLSEKLGPIIHLQLGQVSAIVISSPLLAKEIFKTHDLAFANRPKLLTAEIVIYNCTNIVFSPYGEYWRQVRKICILELLSVKKVESFRYIREEESWNLVESIAIHGSKTMNLSEKIYRMMNAIACRSAFGSRCEDQTAKLFVDLLDELDSLSGGFDVSDLFPSFKILHRLSGMRNKLMKIHKKLDPILDDIILEHQQHRAVRPSNYNEDIVDVLLRLKDDGGLQFPLTLDNIKAVILDMFAAGTNTSSTTIDWTMSELMKNPRVMKKAQDELRQILNGKKTIHESDIQELDYLKLVIKETLRIHPPFAFIPRECRENCDLGGYHIPVNTKTIINIWKIGRDPDYWTDPEKFIPERFSESSMTITGTDFEYIPFGGGRRICPGINMGLTNVELPLAMLLYHFDWQLPSDVTCENLDMTEAFGVGLTRKNNLHLVPSVYNIGH